MKQTLEYILKSIVEFPDDITVEEQTEESRIVFVVSANEKDMGKIIGKSGRIIRAIRDLIKLMAAKDNVYADVVLTDDAK